MTERRDRITPSWLGNWQRSPRQDRRVVVDGKFVELTEPIIPKTEEETDGPTTGTGTDVPSNGATAATEGETATSEPVADGVATGSVEPVSGAPDAEPEPEEAEVTFDDIDKAIASIPEPKTFDDYGKTYTVHPGGAVTENPRPPKVEPTIEQVNALAKALGLDIEESNNIPCDDEPENNS